MHRLRKIVSQQSYKTVSYYRSYKSASADYVLNMEEMPHPRELPLFGTKLSLLAAGSGSKLHEYIDNRHKHLGPIFYERLGGASRLVFISDPALMKTLFLNLEGKYPAHLLPEPWLLYEQLYGAKRGLFFMNNEEWLTNRRIVNRHVLREDSDKWLQSPVKDTINKFVQKWRKQAKNDETFMPELESDLYRLSTDVIISVLLGGQCMTESLYYEELLKIFSESVKKIFETTTSLYALPVSWYQQLNLKPWREFKESVDTSIFLAQKIVQEMLNKKESNKGLIRKLCQEQMSDDTITRIVADFVIAAGDTTTYTTLWTLLLLSNNDVEKKQIRENDATYVKNVVKEAMRLYPVAPFLTRILPKESVLGQYILDKGTPVIASVYTIGRDDNNFSEASKFAPYRWSRNDPKKLNFKNHIPSASLPFALGARSCIGKKIAMLQLTEIIRQIVLNFEFTCVNSNEVNAITSQVLVPNQDIKLKLTLREDFATVISD
nr:shadow [Chilo suppressalis]